MTLLLPSVNSASNATLESADFQTQPLTSATGLHQFSPERILFPNCETDIVAAVKYAAAQQTPIRAIGAMHSYSPIFTTVGTCLVLERYSRLVDISEHQVTVEAGMTLAALNEQLAQLGLALPVMSAIASQTVSGAIATGAHGGSLYHPNLSGYVLKLRLVKADGSVITLQPSEAEFNAVAISMGLLGIVSTITLKCVPAFRLVAKSHALSCDEFVEQFDSIHQNNQYVDVKYVPITDRVQVLTMNKTHQESAQQIHTVQMASPAQVRRLKTHVLRRMLKLFQNPRWRWLQFVMFKRHENNIYPGYRCQRGDRILTDLDYRYYDPIPMHNMEIAVPYSCGPAVLQSLRERFRQTRRYPNIFIRIRVSKADAFWLSPAYQQAVCWFDFCEYPYSGDFFREMIDLLQPFDFRCHWGKEIQASPDYLRSRYEKWPAFMSLRDRWDKQRLFANPTLDHFFSRS